MSFGNHLMVMDIVTKFIDLTMDTDIIIVIITIIVVIVTVTGTEETIMVDTGMIITTIMDTAVKLLFVDYGT